MKFQQIVLFFGALYKSSTTISELRAITLNPEFDWHQLFRFADQALVTPAIYSRCKSKGFLSILGQEELIYVQSIYHMNRDRNIQIVAQYTEIIHLFARANIFVLPLKGINLISNGQYADIGERIVGDIDILLIESEIAAATEILLSDGYQELVSEFPQPPWSHHTKPLSRQGRPVAVELHSHVVTRRFPTIAEKLTSFALSEKNKCHDSNGNIQYCTPKGFSRVLCAYHSHVQDRALQKGYIDLRHMIDFHQIQLYEPATIDNSHRIVRELCLEKDFNRFTWLVKQLNSNDPFNLRRMRNFGDWYYCAYLIAIDKNSLMAKFFYAPEFLNLWRQRLRNLLSIRLINNRYPNKPLYARVVSHITYHLKKVI